MICNFSELRNKEVINKINGMKLGTICDFEVDTERGKMMSLIVLGKGKLFSAMTQTIKISWSSVEVIGEDTVLVSYTPESEFYVGSFKAGGKRDKNSDFKKSVVTTINIPREMKKPEVETPDFSEFE